jgi:2-haloacid dehalogenase
MTPLKGIQACVFDAYGTLFDVHSAVAQHSARLVDATAVSTLWRTKQLQYTWLRTLMGRYVEFWQVTGDALDFALECGFSDTSHFSHWFKRIYTESPLVFRRQRRET